MQEPKAGYLAEWGGPLIANEYNIIPILPNKKYPGERGWQNTIATPGLHRKWIEQGKAHHGLGILTARTPAIDIDCQDPGASAWMQGWIWENIGLAPPRIGQPPKCLMLFRCETPFRKLTSAEFSDKQGRKNQVEILADGEQFVAFHIHPDTGKPYEWLYGDGPHITPSSELPILTRELAQQIIEEFERYAKEHGWTLRTRSAPLAAPRAEADPFADVAEKTGLSLTEMRAKLMQVPNSLDGADYDTWLQVMMGLHHETDGSDEGLVAFLEWSSQSVKHNDREAERKWASVDIEGKGRAPVTARFILKLAKEHTDATAAEALGGVETAIRTAGSLGALEAAAAGAKRLGLTPAARSGLVTLVQERFKALKGSRLGIREARDLVRFEAPAKPNTPNWLEGYVYVSQDETFFRSDSGVRLTKSAFNDMHGRHLLTKRDVLEGKSIPEHRPSDVALNLAQVETVDNVVYMPGEDDIFTMNGRPYVNSYTERNIPKVPDKLTAADRAAIAHVEKHVRTLITDERDRGLFLDWLAYIVQSRSRPNWAVLLQGTESDGKTFWFELMAKVLGPENVKPVQTKLLESGFNDWAVGALLNVVEEIKLNSHGRYDVLNSIKPNITNDVLSINEKFKRAYVVPNVTAYLMLTNFRDALPLTANDTRYFVLSSFFQTKEALDEFKKKNPDHYADLFAAIYKHGGALRSWFLSRELGPDFDPKGRAPQSADKDYLVDLIKPEDMAALDALIAESPRLDFSKELLNLTDAMGELEDQGIVLPHARVLARQLSDAGWTRLGRVRGLGGERKIFWSQKPQHFHTNRVVDPDKIRDWLEPL